MGVVKISMVIWLLFCAILPLNTNGAWAQNQSEKVMAVFIFKFIDYIQWPDSPMNKIRLCVYVPDTPRHVIGDAGRVRQIVSNLVNNAIKFTHKGYVLITVESDKDGKIKISVKDTGIGIPPEKHDALFQKFSQADTSTTRQYGGTGLGLAISQQLVEMMDGEIGFNSEPSKGSVFWVTMNLPDYADQTDTSHEPSAHIHDVRILVVDDIPINGQLMNERLGLMGMRPTYTRYANKVIEILTDAAMNDDPYKMAVLDYLMPGINGEDLAKEIKSNPLINDIALVMLSSAGGQGCSKRFRDAGFFTSLSKPIRSNELSETIDYAWREYSAGHQTSLGKNAPMCGQEILMEADLVQFSKPRILIAEDNRTNQSFVQEILTQANCVVDIAVNGKEAIQKLVGGSYNLVFMDCEMPEMGGIEATHLLNEMKQDKIIDDIPIVALTANAGQSDRQKCLDAGMADYLAKPLRKNELLNITKKWLSDYLNVQHNVDLYRFDDCQLLLVEDNRTNQMLAEEILNDLGFCVSHAASGDIAVQMAKDNMFDLILMDCQMPVMDGFDATRHIRAIESYGDTPIVALTANAMKGDREKCLDAGMTDYLAKPLRKVDLVTAIAKWIKPQFNQAHDLGEDIIQYIDSEILDEEILRSYEAVMGNQFKQQAESFLHEARLITNKIQTAYDTHDVETIHRRAHSLKSSSAIMGAMELSELCAIIEAEAFEFIQYHKSDDHVFDGRFVGVIQAVFKRVAPLLDTYIQKPQEKDS